MESLITKNLIEGEAAKKGIIISTDEINEEIKKIEDQISSQGGTLDAALAAQGMTRDVLKEQIAVQKKLEKIIADKLNVADSEVEQYIKDSQISIPEGQEAEFKNRIKEQLRGQKINQEAGILIESLRTQAKIRYFTNY